MGARYHPRDEFPHACCAKRVAASSKRSAVFPKRSAVVREKLQRFDRGLARGEALIATVVLLSLVVVAAVQSTFRNFADGGADWANSALSYMHWGDGFMEKATLWLAMLGASLATHYDRHIAIDALSRLASPVRRAVMRGIVQIFASITCFSFARVVLGALLAKAGRIPAEFGVFDENFDTIHICLGTAEQIENAGYTRPDIFCGVRGLLEGLNLQVNTPERAMDLLVPALFCVIAVRFMIKGIGAFLRVREGGIPDHELEGGDDPTRLPDEVEADRAAEGLKSADSSDSTEPETKHTKKTKLAKKAKKPNRGPAADEGKAAKPSTSNDSEEE